MCGVQELARFFLVLSFANVVFSSAIPMWEYLERTEKMNLLYSMFTKQVSAYCGTVVMPDGTDCQKVFLLYGLTNLAKMSEDSLDKMDPYQRGATGIIWESMMKGSYKPMEGSEPHKIQHTHSEENETGSGSNNLGSQVEASSNIPQYTGSNDHKYVVGPMIVRVLPNGRPVPGESHLPDLKDEDAEDFKLMSAQPPSEIIERSTDTSNQYYSHKLIRMDSNGSKQKQSPP